jgi:VWFA-related protein
MVVRPGVAASVIVVGLMAWLAGGADAQTFRARTDLVHMSVIVTDRQGNLVNGLTADDFEVVDGGTTRPIVTFAQGTPPPEAGVPLHVGVMLDKSESMELDARVAANAVVRFVEAMPEAADVTLVEFDSSVRVSRFNPSSYPQLFARVRDRTSGRETALYDAIGRYVETTATRPGLHLLVVFTDGGDSGRGLNASDVQMRLRQGNVFVYGIVYLENQSPTERGRQRAITTQLVRDTGGEAHFPSSEADITRIYDRIRQEMAARYTLGYEMPADAASGQYRRVSVRLKSPDGRGLRLRARSGYLVPDP